MPHKLTFIYILISGVTERITITNVNDTRATLHGLERGEHFELTMVVTFDATDENGETVTRQTQALTFSTTASDPNGKQYLYVLSSFLE